MKTKWILNIFVFVQIHLENSHFLFVTRIMLFECPALFLSYVCARFNICFFALSFACIYLLQNACPIVRPNSICLLSTKNACSPRLVNNSFKTYGTSPVPLLRRNVQYVCGAVARDSRNISKSKLNYPSVTLTRLD